MNRWAWTLAACCLASIAGAVLYHTGFWDDTPASRISVRQAQQRFYQCQPHHWRSLLLQR